MGVSNLLTTIAYFLLDAASSAPIQVDMVDKPMDLFVNIATIILSFASVISFAVLQRSQNKHDHLMKKEEKKNTWYQSEVLSKAKLKSHVDKMKLVLSDPELDHKEMCELINMEMQTFFNKSVNYIAFFDKKQYKILKQKIMAAVDNVMNSILLEKTLQESQAEQILDIYQMKLNYLFYEYDMKM